MNLSLKEKKERQREIENGNELWNNISKQNKINNNNNYLKKWKKNVQKMNTEVYEYVYVSANLSSGFTP